MTAKPLCSLRNRALIGSILEMAKLTNTAAPSIDSVYALVKLLNKVMLRKAVREGEQSGLAVIPRRANWRVGGRDPATKLTPLASILRLASEP